MKTIWNIFLINKFQYFRPRNILTNFITRRCNNSYNNIFQRFFRSTRSQLSTNLRETQTFNELSFAQPTSISHPNFFTNSQDVIPGISKEELRQRREKFCAIIHHFSKQHAGKWISSLVIIPSSTKLYMTENIPYPFRQNSNFFYLTGSYDPDSLLILMVNENGEQRHTLILNDPDPISDLWDGRKTTPQAAKHHLGLDQSIYYSNLDILLRDYGIETEGNFLVWSEDKRYFDKLRKHFITYSELPGIQSPRSIFHSLRVIKSPGEIDLMRLSAQISSKAFQSTMSFCGSKINSNHHVTEHQIWAKLDYECRLNGADRLAYPPVVASGSRANIIHYVHNKNICRKEDLCLVDAGCEVFGYCSDITRTFPVSGKFSNDYQRTLYELVLDIQLKIIQRVQPGESLDQLFRVMGSYMVEGLKNIGVLQSISNISTTELALKFCPHHVSHYLGLDVHDCPTIQRQERLRPGMIITVEPGIYISSNSTQWDYLTKAGREFDGIGIRIEDDILVNSKGNEVLTSSCPKTIQELEYWGTQPHNI